MANLTRLSKFLSLMLRHKAVEFGLSLDSEGFTTLDSVWQQIQKRYPDQYTMQDLNTLLEKSPDGKQRFEVIQGRIRALYGHSSVPEIEYPAVEPPEILYHGTTPQALASIREHGLNSQQRQYVHLSTDTERASTVAGRRGKPVLLVIRAKAAHAAGLIFHHPEPKHYLVKAIPPEFIEFPE
ncbi:MAG: RNA 2'-phosphotransferase [bacterium]|nr:RNA 2'-phosphotransferase [bacterium]